MVLLERGTFLGSLDGWLAEARDGRGCLVLVGGEAGIGKTSLVSAFHNRRGGDARVVWGACDALRTPRPLGPLLDIAREAGGELAALVAAEPTRHRLFGRSWTCSTPLAGRWWRWSRTPTGPTRTPTGPTRPPWTCWSSSAAGWPRRRRWWW